MSAEGQLGEILELIRASSPTEREQIFQALAKENDVAGASAFRAADLINRQIEVVSDLLGCSPDEAALLLGKGDYSANVDWSALTERIADFIDTHWTVLEPNLEKLSLDELFGLIDRKNLSFADRTESNKRSNRKKQLSRTFGVDKPFYYVKTHRCFLLRLCSIVRPLLRKSNRVPIFHLNLSK